jgi:hypothetical protein
MNTSKTFVKPIAPEQQLPTLIQAINILQKLAYHHHRAVTEHGCQNYANAKVWHNKATEFLNNHIIQNTMDAEKKYSVHNTTHNSYLIPNPNGLQGSYIFSLEKEKTVWFDNQLYTEVMVERYNEMYPECTFKLITNNRS